jgi:polysaccharide export outer membrane protein
MKKMTVRLFGFFLIFMMMESCVSTKSTTYFNNASDTLLAFNSIKAFRSQQVPKIQKNDILNISITSLNQDASAIFNTTNSFVFTSSTSAGLNTQSSGYLVNDNGVINLPLLGNIKAAGLTKDQLKDTITHIILDKHLLMDPIVNIRHVNYEVTVIGEVGKPSVISVPNENISLLKAIGLAGDITIYGRKDNVLLIRESDGIKQVKYINLNSKDFLQSPYYYLQPNDVVYVEANKNKVASVGRGTRLLPVFLSGLSVVILLVDRVLYQ